MGITKSKSKNHAGSDKKTSTDKAVANDKVLSDREVIGGFPNIKTVDECYSEYLSFLKTWREFLQIAKYRYCDCC